VLTVGYGTTEMPAFYSRESGIKLDYSISSPEDGAKLFLNGYPGRRGYLLFNPIPKDAEIKREEIEPSINNALQSLREANIHGKQVTPYLLAKLAETTEGRSVQANLALIKNNVRVGSLISIAISKQ